MVNETKDAGELQSIYERRFTEKNTLYRARVWDVLVTDFFSGFVGREATVLDLGCGYGEFINAVQCRAKLAMDLNPKAREYLAAGTQFHQHDCTVAWPIASDSLDVVFTSNFFEHLPDKLALKMTLAEARRCLKPRGLLIALGPNIRFVQGAYWDFWDHYLCLTEKSLAEAMENNGYEISRSHAQFLPYTTINQPLYPMFFVRMYLRLPLLWRIFGRQFLVVARKSGGAAGPVAN